MIALHLKKSCENSPLPQNCNLGGNRRVQPLTSEMVVKLLRPISLLLVKGETEYLSHNVMHACNVPAPVPTSFLGGVVRKHSISA